jgi:hypothetical protein
MERAMGVLMLKCPVGGQEFSTGIQIEHDSLEMLPEARAKARYPSCQNDHTWWTREARLADEIPPDQWVEAFDRSPRKLNGQ